MVGRPVTILIDGEVHIEKLRDIFNREDVRDLPACTVAITGAMRSGKSFLLCYLLRYLTNSGSDDWMGGENKALSGFHHEQSEDGVTKGITIWSEPFIVNTPTGKVAVFLLDSQGAFDSTATGGEENFIFALTQTLSSVMVYNVMSRINENDLKNFQESSSYAKSEDLCFQKLVFLVRDWNSPRKYDYGSAGGEHFCYDKLLVDEDSQSKRSQEIRQYLWITYQSITCFLMPDPGTNVREKEGFDGRLADLNGNFKHNLKDFVEQLLSPHNLIIKNMNGQDVTSGQLYNHIKEYSEDASNNMNSFESGTGLEMNAEHISDKIMKDAHKEFIKKLELIKEDVHNVVKSKEVMGLFSEIKDEVTSAMTEVREIIGDRLNARILEQVTSSIANEVDKELFNIMKRGQKGGLNEIVNEISLAVQRILMGICDVKDVVQQVESRVVGMLVNIIEKISTGVCEWFSPKFHLWMNLHEKMDHAVAETYMMFDKGNRYAAINSPEVAERIEKQFEKCIQDSVKEYIWTFEKMGLMFWAQSIMFGCVFGFVLGATVILACTSAGGAVLGAAAGTAFSLVTAGAAATGAVSTAGVAGGTAALMGAEAVSAVGVGVAAEAGAVVAGIGTKAILTGALFGGAAVGGVVAAGGLVYYLMKKHRKSRPKPPIYQNPPNKKEVSDCKPSSSKCGKTVANKDIEQLTGLGYDEIKVREALSASNNDIAMALQILQWGDLQENSCDEVNFLNDCYERKVNVTPELDHQNTENSILNDSLEDCDVIERLQNIVNVSRQEAQNALIACEMDVEMAADVLIQQYSE